MHSDNTSRRHVRAPLAWRIADDSTAAEIAAACVALWLELEAVLTPIIGPRGVTALGQRSLHLASVHCPCLATHHSGGVAKFDAALLKALLMQSSSVDAAIAAGDTFLQTFHDLLSSLIGAPLTERILRTVWGAPDPIFDSPTAQDPT